MSNPYPSDTDWPANFNGCHITATYIGLDGAPIANGVLTLSPRPIRILDFTAARIILPRPLTVTLDAHGHCDLYVPATDDPDISPIGWTYVVNETFPGGMTWDLEAPNGQTIDLCTESPVPAADGTPVVRGPRGLDGAVQTVQGQSPDEASNVNLGPVVLLRANNLSDLLDPVAARAALGLGSAALKPQSFFASTVQAALVANNLSDLQDPVASRGNLGLGNTDAARANLGLGSAAVHPEGDFVFRSDTGVISFSITGAGLFGCSACTVSLRHNNGSIFLYCNVTLNAAGAVAGTASGNVPNTNLFRLPSPYFSTSLAGVLGDGGSGVLAGYVVDTTGMVILCALPANVSLNVGDVLSIGGVISD